MVTHRLFINILLPFIWSFEHEICYETYFIVVCMCLSLSVLDFYYLQFAPQGIKIRVMKILFFFLLHNYGSVRPSGLH